jgi:hypothetical protein
VGGYVDDQKHGYGVFEWYDIYMHIYIAYIYIPFLKIYINNYSYNIKIGPTTANTSDSGLTASSTARASTSTTGTSSRASGRTGSA